MVKIGDTPSKRQSGELEGSWISLRASCSCHNSLNWWHLDDFYEPESQTFTSCFGVFFGMQPNMTRISQVQKKRWQCWGGGVWCEGNSKGVPAIYFLRLGVCLFFFLFQPHWLLRFSNPLTSLPPHGLCTSCSFGIGHSPLSSFLLPMLHISQLSCLFLQEAAPDATNKIRWLCDTGSRRSKACLSVVGRVIIWV